MVRGTSAHTQHNVDVINQTCASYTRGANAYTAAIAQDASQASTSDHPADQERIAAIAAETDWLHGARPLSSMQTYPRTYTVIVALVRTKSPIFAGLKTAENSSPSGQSSAGGPITDQRDFVSTQNARSNAEATAAIDAAIEAERQRMANLRARERAIVA